MNDEQGVLAERLALLGLAVEYGEPLIHYRKVPGSRHVRVTDVTNMKPLRKFIMKYSVKNPEEFMRRYQEELYGKD